MSASINQVEMLTRVDKPAVYKMSASINQVEVICRRLSEPDMWSMAKAVGGGYGTFVRMEGR